MKKDNYIFYEGVKYPLDEWLTTPALAKKYKLKRFQRVNNLIYDGRIPLKNVLEIPELNYLRLVKSEKYI